MENSYDLIMKNVKQPTRGGTRIEPAYLSIKELAHYSGISERALRDFLTDPVDPIPHFRIGISGRIIRIRKNDFDDWIEHFRVNDGKEMDEILKKLTC